MNTNVDCEIEVYSDVDHLKQVYAGFSLLDRFGMLKLRQVIPKLASRNLSDPDKLTDYKYFNTKVILNGAISIVYDMHDRNWIDQKILAGVDFYFKRSFDSEYLSGLSEGNKVFPLGLNYPVSTDHVDIFKIRRSSLYSGKARIKAIAKGLRLDRFGVGPGEVERVDILNGMPDFLVEPRVLFMAKVWNPDAVASENQKNSIKALNEVRAECIRTLRAEFKDRFFGGLARDEYSIQHYEDCLLPDSSHSGKRNYLNILRNFPICVTTTGLNGSNGWKLGEYVAFSKAIISEPLLFSVPGNFTENTNYLKFSTPEDLVEAVTKLFENRLPRYEMMMNNRRYYETYVRPDAMILNTLHTVFQQSDDFFK